LVCLLGFDRLLLAAGDGDGRSKCDEVERFHD
jgi:hypothetical protein